MLVILVYAVLIGQSFLWLWTVLTVATLGFFVSPVYLFYRLVVAVERIAYGP